MGGSVSQYLEGEQAGGVTRNALSRAKKTVECFKNSPDYQGELPSFMFSGSLA